MTEGRPLASVPAEVMERLWLRCGHEPQAARILLTEARHRQPRRPLRDVPDQALGDLWTSLGPDPEAAAAVMDECRRRDVSAQDRRWYQACREAWYLDMHAQYELAEAETRGNLLSREGTAKKITPWPQLWQGAEPRARRLASEELNLFWNRGGACARLTVSEWAEADKRSTNRDDIHREDLMRGTP
jgi:hypothetical protein